MSRQALLRLSTIVNVVCLLAIAVWFAQLAFPSDHRASREAVRLRNSLLAQVGGPADFDWTPAAIPAGFQWESGPVPDEMTKVAQHLLRDVPQGATSFDRALELARHLKANSFNGSPISSSTVKAYQRIANEGVGWCSDFTQVMNGIGVAADLPIREWGISFDGFSGDGHAFNEVYDDALGKWVFFDSFYSFYVRDPDTGVPMSALEFRQGLKSPRPEEAIEVVPITDKFAFQSPVKVLDYYRRGADQFYLWWGNDVFTYDANGLVDAFGTVARSLGQMAGIMTGVHPEIRILPDPEGEALVERLFDQRRTFLLLSGLGAGLGVLLIVQVVALVGHRRRGASSRQSAA